jgi:putative nucleotidyltransferase with HDIG domain
MRIIYRMRQTWAALTAKPDRIELQEVKEYLSPAEYSLFIQLHPSEQSHSISVFHQLRRDGVEQPDLLKAALLHDVGKTRYPLHLWDRILIVLGRKIAPGLAGSISVNDLNGWKRPLIVSQKHAEWGAEMAAGAGASQLTVALINRHQQELLTEEPPLSYNHSHNEPPELSEDQLLALLQKYDNNY